MNLFILFCVASYIAVLTFWGYEIGYKKWDMYEGEVCGVVLSFIVAPLVVVIFIPLYLSVRIGRWFSKQRDK